MSIGKFPHYSQLDTMDCGPTCLRIIARYHGRIHSRERLREKSYLSREGVSLLGISVAAEDVGFKTLSAKMPFNRLMEEAPTPFIAHWRQRHFIVVYKFSKNKVFVSDPAFGLVTYSKEEFLDGWISDRTNGESTGAVLLLEPMPRFYKEENEEGEKKSLGFFFNYLKPYKKFFLQLLLGMLVGSILQLCFPFLTQSVVDVGIKNQDVDFITLILIAQLMLFLSQTSMGFIRGWILLHIGIRLNISIISDFLIKLMKLPISYFDTKMIGDIMQRMGDHRRIEAFLTSSSLNIIFSMVNLVVFSLILVYYSLKIFSVFLIGSIIYMVWIFLFLKKRRMLDHKRFDEQSAHQSNLIQLITGMQEIKLHNSEKQKRWEWERIQTKLFKTSIKGLALTQYQQAGSSLINGLKNIVITFLSASSVINGEITLGMMLAIQYIIGQLNSPIRSMIGFVHRFQDAKISLERLSEIHELNDEVASNTQSLIFPVNRSLSLEKIYFAYNGPNSAQILKDVSLNVPEGKITAIVGPSGSGKTTLLKLLLRFYEPSNGVIKLGGNNLANYDHRIWRDKCGAVLQDGFIFSDTIARNIAVNDEYIDKEKLLYAVQIANIQGFIDSLPLGYNTKIGSDGHGLSQGQRQRILIARAVYKNPDYIFFDEATNALDANNEKTIMENLDRFFKGRTVVVVAHRLSTVKNADQIIVLEKGQIKEVGTHASLTENRGNYFELVRNQLELGN